MVTIISTPGWSAAGSARKVLTPVEDHLEVVHLFNADTMRGDARNFGINFAKDKRDSIVVGAPTLHGDGNSAVFKSLTNYIQSRWFDSEAQSHLIVCATDDTMVDDAHRPAFLGTFTGLPSTGGGVTTFGSRLFMNGVDTLRWAVGRGNNTTDDLETSATLTVPPTAYQMYLALCPAGTGRNSLANITAGSSVQGTLVPLPRMWTINRMRYGSAHLTQAGTCRIAAVISASKLWSADEQTAMSDWLREYMLARGVTI